MANDYTLNVIRAALPEVMFVPDIGAALRLGPAATRRAVLRGACGPYVRIGRRLAVLRTSFLDALARQQTTPLAVVRGAAPY